MRVGSFLVQLHCAKYVRINVLFELLQVLLEGLEKRPIEGTLKLLYYLRSDFLLKAAF